MQDKRLPGYKAAAYLMREYNPNDVVSSAQGINFFAGLEGKRQRFVPFNGGVGERQRAWLRKEVVAARERGDRIVLLAHLPAYAPAASTRTMCFDGDEVLQICHDDGCGHVVALIAGHMHRGGYAVDAEGMHHVTLESPMTHKECFGWVDVFGDRLEIVGHGDLPSRTLRFPPLQPVPRTATPSAKL